MVDDAWPLCDHRARRCPHDAVVTANTGGGGSYAFLLDLMQPPWEGTRDWIMHFWCRRTGAQDPSNPRALHVLTHRPQSTLGCISPFHPAPRPFLPWRCVPPLPRFGMNHVWVRRCHGRVEKRGEKSWPRRERQCRQKPLLTNIVSSERSQERENHGLCGLAIHWQHREVGSQRHHLGQCLP